MDIYRFAAIGRNIANRTIKATWPHTLRAEWDEMPAVVDAYYDDADGVYKDPATRLPIAKVPRTLDIAALFDLSPDMAFRYAKDGVDVKTDLVAVVPYDTALPDTTAIYYKNNDRSIPYKLKGLIDRADIGVGPAGLASEVAYLVLHLTRGGTPEA